MAERYRYDALGRRVWQQMIRDASCPHHDPSSGCRNEVTRTVWAGDQVLYEIRQLADTIGGASESDVATSLYTGVVGYTHAGGIDAPLALFKGTQLAVLYTNWEGTYDRATCPVAGATTPAPCDALTPYFPMTGGTVYGEAPALPTGPPSWYGSVITGMTDGSGYQYRRNRYYDPKSGRFTTEDPIGLAGGLNAYGYADGDPVTYSDPFGLCKNERQEERRCTVSWSDEASNTDITAETRAFAQSVADQADVDLVLSSGRRATGDDCSKSRHNCGKAVDISSINGVDVGDYGAVNANAMALIRLVVGVAMGISDTREALSPLGFWNRGSADAAWAFQGSGLGGSQWFASDSWATQWARHQNHIHLSIQ